MNNLIIENLTKEYIDFIYANNWEDHDVTTYIIDGDPSAMIVDIPVK